MKKFLNVTLLLIACSFHIGFCSEKVLNVGESGSSGANTRDSIDATSTFSHVQSHKRHGKHQSPKYPKLSPVYRNGEKYASNGASKRVHLTDSFDSSIYFGKETTACISMRSAIFCSKKFLNVPLTDINKYCIHSSCINYACSCCSGLKIFGLMTSS